VKRADRPDSVQRRHLSIPPPWPPFLWAGHRCPARCYLPAGSCGATLRGRRAEARRPAPAYLVLLRVEIARFTRSARLAAGAPTRLCCSDPHLAVDSR